MFWRKKQLISPIKSVSHPVFQWGEDDIPRYPPFMKGLPVVPPSKLIETQKELVDRIANSTIATPEGFQKHYLAAIERFASFSHLLPASQSHHHRGAGGLLRHAIEVGLWALQSADRVLIKSAVSPMHRREMEPRWQLAVFLAGMCHDAGKPVTDLTVTNKERTSTWHPITEDLFSWAIKNSVHAYFLEWREGRGKQHTALSSLIAERIIGAESLAWIAEVDTDLVVWLMESLAGNPGPTNLICDLVTKADQTSVERDLKTLGVAMAGYDLGVPIERHLIDIMRRFVREGMWLVNIPGARLWNIEGHLYLVWPAAGEELARQIKEDGVPGMPRTPDGILDMLTDRGMAFLKEDVSPEERLWKIAPAVLAEKIPDIKLTAIRLRDEAMVSSIPLPSAPGRIISTVQAGATMTDSNALSLQSRDAQTVPDALSKDHPTEVTPSPLPLEISTRTKVTEAKNLKKPRSAVVAPIHLDGAIGEALKALAQDLKANDKKFGHDAIVSQEGHVFLRWPDAFAGYGLAPKIVLDQLTERGWLVIDPMSPLKRTNPRNFGDGANNAVHLNLDISTVFLALSGQPGNDSNSVVEPASSSPGSMAVPTMVNTQKPITSSKPAGPRDSDAVAANQDTSTIIPTLDAVLRVLRSLGLSPQADGYCWINKTEGLKACKSAGMSVNHRIFWKFDELKSEQFAIQDGKVRFKP
jgi:conjugal transfer pilus assembly protein TraI